MDINAFYTLSQEYITIKSKPYQRDFLRNNEHFKHRFSTLIGQRGIGKTTMIIQHLLNQVDQNIFSKEILYIPADHFIIGDTSLYDIAEYFYQHGGKFIAFDEIHKHSNWSNELKSIYDTFPNLTILASGSSALEICKGTHDLTRRTIVYTLKGLSFREHLEMSFNIQMPSYTLQNIIDNHEEISRTIMSQLKDHKILSTFKTYLASGYYPYALEMQGTKEFHITLEQDLHTTIESDLPAIYQNLTGNSVKKLKQLLIFIAESVPFSATFEKLKSMLDIGDIRTLKTYLSYLEDAGLICTVMKSSNKLVKVESPEKIYLGNPNQLHAISKSNQNNGTVRELFFINMLSYAHNITAPKIADFLVDNTLLFEVGGKKKGFKQIQDQKNAYLACDDIESGSNNKIPLWLFGFLY